MPTRNISNLTIEDLTELIDSCDKEIENIKQLRAREQQLTHARHPDPRYTAIIQTLESQRLGYGVLRTRKQVIGR